MAPSILHQIGALSSLQNLSVGVNREYEVEESPFLQLSMDPDYGLPQFTGLQQLKSLKVVRLVHDVGQEEIEWMKLHWPLLVSLELPILVESGDGFLFFLASKMRYDLRHFQAIFIVLRFTVLFCEGQFKCSN